MSDKINKTIKDIDVSWDKKSEDDLKNYFDLSMDEEVGKLLGDMKKKDKNKPKILENVPEEFMNGDKKILLEG